MPVNNDVPLWRVQDLRDGLSDLADFKEQLPRRYQADIQPILEDPDRIRRIYEEYAAWAKGAEFPGDFKSFPLVSLLELRRIDKDRFQRDL